MTYPYVFVLGRPGCGKSALYREIEAQIRARGQGVTLQRIDDFPKLWAMYQRDNILEDEGQPRIATQRTDDGDFTVVGGRVWDAVLVEVNRDLTAIDQPDHLVFVEFARADYVSALGCFDERVLDRSLVVYLDVDFDTCWERILARHRAAVAEGGDDHYVAREEMRASYLVDDRDALVRELGDRGIPMVVIDNQAEGVEHLAIQAAALCAKLL